MNALGIFLVGAAVRGTALVAVGATLGWALRRKGPAASALMALATLVGMVGLAALGASPWPRWGGLTDATATDVVRRAETARGQAVGAAERVPASDLTAVAARAVAAPEPPEAGLVGSLRLLGRALMSPASSPVSEGWGWPAWVALAAMVGVAVGIGRFALGLAAVGALRRGSRAVADADLLELAAVLRQRLGVGPRVEVRVAPGLAMPATIGSLHPLILLPEDWPAWDDRERRVVLSHELAHIRRHDYLAGVWAQLSLALQFYHPLAHWLARRLRLDQELAADAWGAALSGGNRTYLATLARLALRNEPRPVGWAARSFSPARGTFLRRIEMLRDANDVSPAPLTRRSRALAIGALALAVLALAGLRGPAGPGQALAASQAPKAIDGGGLRIDGGFIPADAAMVAVIRPAELLARPEFKAFLQSMDLEGRLRKDVGIPPEEIEQVTFVWLRGKGRQGPPRQPSAVIARAAKPQDWKSHTDELPGPKEAARFGDLTYYRSPGGAGYARPDDRTLILAEESDLLRVLAARPGDADRAAWAGAWKEVRKGQAAVAVDTTWLMDNLKPAAANRPPGGHSPFDGFEPLLSQAGAYAVSIDLLGNLRIDGVGSCASDAGAAQVADTLKALLVLGRNMLDSVRERSLREGRQVTTAEKLGLDAAAALGRAEIKVDGRLVRVSATSDLDPAKTVAALAPALTAQRAAAMRAQSVNNMKQIGLAMFNYAGQHKDRFPPAVLIGPDGKTPHSWRVAILPYIDQKPLYDQYKLDEPWDGPNNRKLLDKMPVLYAHPDARTGTSTSYFMTTGPHTISSDNRGSALSEIIDGTSNTIMVVEAERDIPWMKPEDIPAPAGPEAQGQPLPKFGGFSPNGFNVLFADGAVRFIAHSIDPNVLKTLLSKDGGEPFSF